MGTKAYLMVSMDKKLNEDGYYLDAVRELETIPEVESVEPVSGVCDLLVKVDAPIRVIFVANKIRAKKWVKNIHVLEVGPSEAKEVSELVALDLVKI